jgi:hypothetical protein
MRGTFLSQRDDGDSTRPGEGDDGGGEGDSRNSGNRIAARKSCQGAPHNGASGKLAEIAPFSIDSGQQEIQNGFWDKPFRRIFARCGQAAARFSRKFAGISFPLGFRQSHR